MQLVLPREILERVCLAHSANALGPLIMGPALSTFRVSTVRGDHI